MLVWFVRGAWLTLPLTAGGAAADAISDWSDAPKILAAVLLWVAWGAVTLAVLAPRPEGLTLLRTVAPAFAALAIAALAAGDTSGLEGGGAVAATVVASGLAMLPGFAVVAANGISYGDEIRFPLRTPPALFLGPLPLARALVVASVAGGPLLLADGNVLWGLLACAAGAPVVLFGARSLNRLARRWVVLVPAGLVVVDPMTLVDSVLMMRRQVRTLRRMSGGDQIPDALDLRLGATTGNVLVDLNEPIEIMRALRGRPSQTERGSAVLVAVADRGQLLTTATGRRLPVRLATEAPQTG